MSGGYNDDSGNSPPWNAAWLAKRLGVTVNPDGWTSAACPAHGDDNPSLTFRDSDDGMFLHVKCHRGIPCAVEDIALVCGLTDEMAVINKDGWRTQDTIYTYTLADASVAKQVIRTPNKKFWQRHRSESGAWVKKKGPHDPPFLLHTLQTITPNDICYVVEGEKDCLNLLAAGADYVTTNAMGAGGGQSKWKLAHTEALLKGGVKVAAILYDNDAAGIAHARAVKASLVAGGIEATILTLPGIEQIEKKGADVSDWLDAGHTIDEMAQGTVLEEDEPTVKTDQDEDRVLEVEQPYDFTPAFPADHFVSQVIEHASHRTDAALEYAEAGALVLLATATNQVKARVAAYPKGLGTNLYVLGLGSSTRSRKSTVKNIIRAVQADCATLKEGILPEAMTPEAFLEQMAARDRQAATWFHDEFGEFLSKLLHAKYMEGLKGHLLSFYDGDPIRYARHSKRIKGGHKEDDFDAVERPHLSIFGVTTPLLFLKLNTDDITSGLLPRFAVVYPQTKPPRRSLFASAGNLDEEMAALVTKLEEIAAWAKKGVIVEFTPEARAAMDAFDEVNEERLAQRGENVGNLMFVRHPVMLSKVAMLAAVGRPGDRKYLKLVVTAEDVTCAVKVLERWGEFTRAFVRSLSASEFERKLIQCLMYLKKRGGTLLRRDISRQTTIPKRFMDDIEATLLDRGEITCFDDEKGRTWKVKIDGR